MGSRTSKIVLFAELGLCVLGCSLCLRLPTAAFAADKHCKDNEVVVALQHGGNGTVRALNYSGGRWNTRVLSNVPVRVESIDLGKVRSPVNSVVVGLASQYQGSPGQVRVFSYNGFRGAWDEEALGNDIQNNVEAIAAGDYDQDGRAEIYVGLEGTTIEPRIRRYWFNGAWNREDISPPSYQHDIQYVAVTDLYGNGSRSVLALVSDWTMGNSLMELRQFQKINNTWVSTPLATNVGGFHNAERFAVANLDSDPEKEIVVGMWNLGNLVSGGAYMLDWDGSQWQSIPINTTLGIIDGMGVGNFVGSASDILLGTRHQVILYSRTSGPWIPQTLIPSTGAYMTWDADFGSLNELGKIAVAALDQRMVIIRKTSNGTFDASMEVQMPSWIDSIQIGDIDDSRTPCVNAETDSPLAATKLLTTPALHELP